MGVLDGRVSIVTGGAQGLGRAYCSFQRTQTPQDMVGLVVFLAGPGSDFITGQSFLVNGGALFQ